MYSIFAQKDSVGAELGKEDIMLMLQWVDCALLKKEKVRSPWSGSTV
jgi:hypothetical protein